MKTGLILGFILIFLGRFELSKVPVKNTDVFGTSKIYPDKIGGRSWNSSWSDDGWRTLESGQRDRFDNLLVARGNGQLTISGKGTAILSGSSPRMYVYDASSNMKWGDVEITVYAKRGLESEKIQSQGIVIGARSEHQSWDDSHPCLARTYYGRLLNDGRAVFQKEILHEDIYSANKPSENNKAEWKTADGTIPKDLWVGVKFVVYNLTKTNSVKLELYRDLTDGKDGGAWEKVAEYTDSGNWGKPDNQSVIDKCGYSENKVFSDPGTSIFVRNDKVEGASYKKFSIREIEVL